MKKEGSECFQSATFSVGVGFGGRRRGKLKAIG